MNSLSLHINKVVNENMCRPLKICSNISISHNLFVDDIILFGLLCRVTWICYYEIIKNFQMATGLIVNNEKSAIYHNENNQEAVEWLSDLFGIKVQSITCGMKYLGFQIKANGYTKSDWSWILGRFHRRISAWEFRCLSLAGRVVLVQSVLNQLTVYWAHLFAIPASIIKSMNSLSANFIWGGQADKRKFHLTKLANISLPKSMGGWGLLDMQSFGRALL